MTPRFSGHVNTGASNNRRQFLKLTAATGLTGLVAGCLGDDGDDEVDDGDDSDDTVADVGDADDDDADDDPDDFEFTVDNLEPTEITLMVGESIAEVSANVINIGADEGEQLIELSVAGEIVDDYELTLPGFEQETVEFVDIDPGELDPGEYEFVVSSEDDAETGTLVVEPEPEIDVSISGLDPVTVILESSGDEVTVSATASNDTFDAGEETIEYRVDDEVLYDEVVEFDSGEEHPVEFTVEYDTIEDNLGIGQFEHGFFSEDDSHVGTLALTAGEGIFDTIADWNPKAGEFDGTTAESNVTIGNLQIGYPSAGSGLPTTMPYYDDVFAQYRLDSDYGDDSSGDSVSDHSGNGYHGTTGGGVDTTAEGVFSTPAYDFDGSSDYVDVSGFDEGEGSFGFSLWFRFPEIGEDERYQLFFIDVDGEQLELFYDESRGEAGTIQFLYWDGDDHGDDEYELAAETWYHMAGSYDGNDGTWRLFVDGEEVYEVSGDIGEMNITPGGVGSYIGQHADDAEFKMLGPLDDVVFFTEALLEDDAADLYFGGGDGTFSGSYESSGFGEHSLNTWETLEVESELPEGTTCTITVEVSDDGFDTIELGDEHELSGGSEEFDLTLPDSAEARILVEGESDDVESSWIVERVQVVHEEA